MFKFTPPGFRLEAEVERGAAGSEICARVDGKWGLRIRKESRLFYITSSSVCLWWEFK